MPDLKRYSDEELQLFKIQIELKLDKARKDLEFLSDQIENATEARADKGDWVDAVASNSDLEMLQTMASRHRRHIRDLENALLRIRNKSYGICVVTGQLIDQRRLMAVPTTSKCLAAKDGTLVPEKKIGEDKLIPTPKKNKPNTIITKVIRRQTTVPTPPTTWTGKEEEDDLVDDDLLSG